MIPCFKGFILYILQESTPEIYLQLEQTSKQESNHATWCRKTTEAGFNGTPIELVYYALPPFNIRFIFTLFLFIPKVPFPILDIK